MPAPARSAVLLDLDGTLLDTSYFHTVAWWQALDEAGEGRPAAEIHDLIGMGSSELLRQLIGCDSDAISNRHAEIFAGFHGHVRALPGADDLLCAIDERGGTVVVVTSAKEQDLAALFGALEARDRIEIVVHGEETAAAKPAPDVFKLALERAGRRAASTIAIGDSVWDVEAAGRAGLRCIGVTTGGIHPVRLEHAGAVEVYDSCKDLLAHWDTSQLSGLVGPLIK